MLEYISQRISEDMSDKRSKNIKDISKRISEDISKNMSERKRYQI